MSSGELVLLATVATTTLVLGTILQVTAQQEPRVSIRLEHDQAIVCRVPKDATNRWLDMGVEGVLTHGVQLDGESAPITSRIVLPTRLGCDTGDVLTAFCDLTLSTRRHVVATSNLLCRD